MAGQELDVKDQARLHWAFQEDGPSDLAGDGHEGEFAACPACRRNLVFYGVPESDLDTAMEETPWSEYRETFIWECYTVSPPSRLGRSAMTALWKRQAQRAEERRALEEAMLRIARRVQESVAETFAAYDPRGRVKLYCGRCGEWKPSDDERTLPEHHEKTHGARLVGSFEWMHSVGYGPLDEEADCE